MKELEIKLQVRNNRLKERRDMLGMSQREFTKAAGIPLQQYGPLECMRLRPYYPDGSWKEFAIKLADFHCCAPEELFPQAVLEMDNPVTVRKIDAGDLKELLLGRQENRELGAVTAEVQLVDHVNKALETLTPREVSILKMRYMQERAIEDIGETLGVSKERIRQIEAKALRKLRHPSRSKRLKEFAGESVYRETGKIEIPSEPTKWWARQNGGYAIEITALPDARLLSVIASLERWAEGSSEVQTQQARYIYDSSDVSLPTGLDLHARYRAARRTALAQFLFRVCPQYQSMIAEVKKRGLATNDSQK